MMHGFLDSVRIIICTWFLMTVCNMSYYHWLAFSVTVSMWITVHQLCLVFFLLGNRPDNNASTTTSQDCMIYISYAYLRYAKRNSCSDVFPIRFWAKTEKNNPIMQEKLRSTKTLLQSQISRSWSGLWMLLMLTNKYQYQTLFLDPLYIYVWKTWLVVYKK